MLLSRGNRTRRCEPATDRAVSGADKGDKKRPKKGGKFEGILLGWNLSRTFPLTSRERGPYATSDEGGIDHRTIEEGNVDAAGPTSEWVAPSLDSPTLHVVNQSISHQSSQVTPTWSATLGSKYLRQRRGTTTQGSLMFISKSPQVEVN